MGKGKGKQPRDKNLTAQGGKPTGSQDLLAVSPRPATPRTPERNLDLVGPPITPTKSILTSTILTPKLMDAMEPKDIEEIKSKVPITPIFGGRQESFIEKQATQVLRTFQRLKGEQLELEAKLEEYVSSLNLLDKKWEEGSINLQRGAYAEERKALLEKEQQLMTSVSVLRTMSSQLMGNWGDDMALGARGTIDDWTLVDAIIRCYPELAHAKKSVKSKRTPQKEKNFRQGLIKAYGSAHDQRNVTWCPITRDYVEVATAAHIVNANIGEVTARALFGEDEEHIWNLRNGLIIHRDYERLIDNGKAIILPVSDAPEETKFKFFLLSKDIGRMTILTADELHNRELEFKTDFRPAKRYLYFKFVITLLRRRRGEVPGYLEDLHMLPSPSRSLWASPGPYLKKSILYKFSRQLGCLSVDEADRFWGVEASPLEELSDMFDDLSATLSTKASLASIAGPKRKWKKSTRTVLDDYEDDEDDEDDDEDDDEEEHDDYDDEEDDEEEEEEDDDKDHEDEAE